MCREARFLNYKNIKLIYCMTFFCIIPLASHADEYYDRMAHIGASMITSPLHVTSERECQSLDRDLKKKAEEIYVAHEQCLKVAGEGGFNLQALDSKSKCSKPTCQALHDGRDSFVKHSEKESRACRVRLSDYQKEQRRREDARQRDKVDSTIARSKNNPCVVEINQYKAICTGKEGYETRQQERTCKAELARLRKECKGEDFR